MMTAIDIDNDENVDWLHKTEVTFEISKDGEVIATCDIQNDEIETNDDKLEEYFYLLVDEGIDNGPVGPGDGEEFKELMKRAGYEAKATTETKETKDAVESTQLEAEGWDFQGLHINIENLRGSTRHGKNFHQAMTVPYGYIRNTEGADGDAVDCFVGPVASSTTVYVVHTKNLDNGAYDEDKVMLGFESASEAQDAFYENYNDKVFFESMDKMSMSEFKRKLTELRGRKIV